MDEKEKRTARTPARESRPMRLIRNAELLRLTMEHIAMRNLRKSYSVVNRKSRTIAVGDIEIIHEPYLLCKCIVQLDSWVFAVKVCPRIYTSPTIKGLPQLLDEPTLATIHDAVFDAYHRGVYRWAGAEEEVVEWAI